MDESAVAPPEELSPQAQFEHDLLVRLSEALPNRSKNVAYSRVNIDWKKVAFDEHSAMECRECWAGIQARLRLHRTMGELIEDAQAARWDVIRMRRAMKVRKDKEGAPKHPGNAFVLFCQKMRPKILKKNPGLGVMDVTAKLTQRYAALSLQKKAVYRQQAAEAMDRYREEMQQFEREHPELAADGVEPPKKPPRALDLYLKKHPEITRADGKAAFEALPEEEKERYQAKARRARERYKSKAAAFQEQYPGWQMPARALGTLRAARHLVPRNPYNIFMRETYHTLDAALPSAERLSVCSRMWRDADAETRARCQRTADEENVQIVAQARALSPEAQLEMSAKMRAMLDPKPRVKRAPRNKKVKVKRVKRVTAKDLFLREKMPAESGALSEDEWRRILSRKFSKLSDADKATYTARAKEVTEEARAKAIAEAEAAAEEAADARHDGDHDGDDDGDEDGDEDGEASVLDTTRDEDVFEDEDEEEEEPEPSPVVALSPKKIAPVPWRKLSAAAEKAALQAAAVQAAAAASAEMVQEAEVAAARPLPNGRAASADSGDDRPAPDGDTRRGNKRSSAAAVTATSTEHDSADGPKKKKKKKALKEEEPAAENNEEVDTNGAVFEWFLSNYRTDSTSELTPRKKLKKAKKAWMALSDEERRVTERRYHKQAGRR